MTIYKNKSGAVNVEWRHASDHYLADKLPEDYIPAYTMQLATQNMLLDSVVYGFVNSLEAPTKFIMYGCPKYAGKKTPSTLILPRIEAYAAQIGLPFIKYKVYADDADIDVLSYERLVEGNAI